MWALIPLQVNIMATDGPVRATRFTPNLVVGLTILIIGLTLMLDRLGLVSAWTIVQYWPVMVILFGASVVAVALYGSADDMTGGGRRLVGGPAILFLIIIGFMASSREHRSVIASEGSDDYVSIHAVLSGNEHVSHSDKFKGAQLTSVMGGTSSQVAALSNRRETRVNAIHVTCEAMYNIARYRHAVRRHRIATYGGSLAASPLGHGGKRRDVHAGAGSGRCHRAAVSRTARHAGAGSGEPR